MASLDMRVGRGTSEFDAAVFLDYVKHHAIDCATLGAATWSIPVELGAVVLGVRAVVTESVATATTAKLGDSANDDGFLEVGDFLLTAGTIVDSRFLTGAYKAGKQYPTAPDRLVVTFDQEPTNGTVEVDVMLRGYAPVEKDTVAHYN